MKYCIKRFTTLMIMILGLVACGSQPTSHQILPSIKTITGEIIDFNHLNRPWVIVNYWANWCEPCKKEIPELNAFSESHDNVYMVGVNYDGVDNRQLTELIAKNDIHYFNSMLDPSQELGVGDIPGLPVTFIFNQAGKLTKTLYGPQTQKTLSEVIS
jgi:thiol-disulfide isomerase/thioredoxin